jgi:two-component system osmolarity sensor histidine kinase EnvZ
MPAIADSLRARLTLLAFATALISVVLTTGLAVVARNRLQEPQLSARVARQYLALQTSVQQGGASPVAGARAWHVVNSPGARPPHDAENLPVYHSLAEQISSQIPGAPEVFIGGFPQPQIWVSLGRGGQPTWAVVPLGQVSTQLPMQLFVSLVVGALGIASLAALTASRITRPLTLLEKAVGSIGSGASLAQLDLPQEGPREIRQLSRRFGEVLASRDAAESARRVMLAGVPHDLRAPLTRLRARLELVSDAKVREGLRQDAEDMRGVVDRFIDFVRGTDPSAYQMAELDLAALVRERCTRWHDSGMELALDLPRASVSLKADRAMLARLFDVLIDNAVRHGRSPITVGLTASGSDVLAWVSDHGPGIDAALRERALEPFARLDEARSGPGTGLGLALAQAIAKGHAGHLELVDTAGGGLTVRVVMPRGPRAR